MFLDFPNVLICHISLSGAIGGCHGCLFESFFRSWVCQAAHVDSDHLINLCENLGQSRSQKQVNRPAGRIQQLPWNSTPAWGTDHRGHISHVGLSSQGGRCIDKCWEGRWRDAFSAFQTPWSLICRRGKPESWGQAEKTFLPMTSQGANRLVK